MHVKRLCINNCTGFENISHDFEKKSYFLVGTNGSGKTSLLKIIYELFKIMECSNHEPFFNKFDSRNDTTITVSLTLNENDSKLLNNLLMYNVLIQYHINIHINYDSLFDKFFNKIIFDEIKITYTTQYGIKLNYYLGEKEICDCNYEYHEKDECPIQTKKRLLHNILKYNKHDNKIIDKNVDKCFINDEIDIKDGKKYFYDYIYFKNKQLLNELFNIFSEHDTRKNVDVFSIFTNHCPNENAYKKCIFNKIDFIKVDNSNDISNKEYYKLYESIHTTQANNFVEDSKLFKQYVSQVNPLYKLREKLFTYKNTFNSKFKNICDDFTNVTNKIVDIYQDNSNDVIDYIYCIIDRDKNQTYECSHGEIELINFLIKIHSNTTDIILIDEPCTHLSQQNKRKIKNILSKIKKQIFLVTHDSKLIDENQNFLYVSNHKIYNTENVNIKRHIRNNPEILFSDKILFVEGISDYVFFKNLLEVFEIEKYEIIELNGCGNDIITVCDDLHILYKVIYDIDKVFSTCTDYTNITENILNNDSKIKNKFTSFIEDHKIIYNTINFKIYDFIDYVNRTTKIFVNDPTFQDLEGISKKLFSLELKKKYWITYDYETLQKKIRSVINDDYIVKIKLFLQK